MVQVSEPFDMLDNQCQMSHLWVFTTQPSQNMKWFVCIKLCKPSTSSELVCVHYTCILFSPELDLSSPGKESSALPRLSKCNRWLLSLMRRKKKRGKWHLTTERLPRSFLWLRRRGAGGDSGVRGFLEEFAQGTIHK